MTQIIRESKKHRREIIINKLIAFQIYKRDDQKLYELSLTELENQYKRFQSHSHPHDGLGSLKIRWKKK